MFPFSSSASAPLVRSLRLPSPSPLPPRTPPSPLYRLRLPKSRRRPLLPSASTAVRAMASEGGVDHRLPRIASTIRVIPDFPKPGIMFQDITTLLLDHEAFRHTIDMFVERYRDKRITVVAGIEARGFIFGPPIALAIGCKFVPMRKPKKLPGGTLAAAIRLLERVGAEVVECACVIELPELQGYQRLGGKPLFVLVKAA
ncbi:hypothetical protein C4D60_Mb05t01610 [Musa balbisiana]|uniref:adenine phosphoribosyltransferase n=1 Tax=Musa balbisiana TaxID=52838 RepID=A0A4S8JSY2_MUSBA|nr:hypothetical protein C4D60_Mb05t01610 [Musa balbisiana]